MAIKTSIQLNIQNDSEFRDYIKECIESQVKAIVRNDFKEMIQQEVKRLLETINRPTMDNLLRAAFANSVSKVLSENYGIQDWGKEFIKPFVEERLSQVLSERDLNSTINSLLNMQIANLLQKK